MYQTSSSVKKTINYPPRHNFKWTVPELITLQREHSLLKLSVEKIAENHKRSTSAIFHQLVRENLYIESESESEDSVNNNDTNTNIIIDLNLDLNENEDNNEDNNNENNNESNVNEDNENDYYNIKNSTIAEKKEPTTLYKSVFGYFFPSYCKNT